MASNKLLIWAAGAGHGRSRQGAGAGGWVLGPLGKASSRWTQAACDPSALGPSALVPRTLEGRQGPEGTKGGFGQAGRGRGRVYQSQLSPGSHAPGLCSVCVDRLCARVRVCVCVCVSVRIAEGRREPIINTLLQAGHTLPTVGWRPWVWVPAGCWPLCANRPCCTSVLPLRSGAGLARLAKASECFPQPPQPHTW